MSENRNFEGGIDKVISGFKKKYILTKEEIEELIKQEKGKMALPISIFNEKLGMLEAASLYLKDKLNLSFNDISRLLKRDYKTIWTSYNKGKRKIKSGR